MESNILVSILTFIFYSFLPAFLSTTISSICGLSHKKSPGETDRGISVLLKPYSDSVHKSMHTVIAMAESALQKNSLRKSRVIFCRWSI